MVRLKSFTGTAKNISVEIAEWQEQCGKKVRIINCGISGQSPYFLAIVMFDDGE